FFFLIPRVSVFFFSLVLPPPTSPLFPYTTLFRSCDIRHRTGIDDIDIRPFFKGNDLIARLFEHFLHCFCLICVYFTSQVVERCLDRKSTRLNSSHVSISYAVFCLKKKKNLQV